MVTQKWVQVLVASPKKKVNHKVMIKVMNSETSRFQWYLIDDYQQQGSG